MTTTDRPTRRAGRTVRGPDRKPPAPAVAALVVAGVTTVTIVAALSRDGGRDAPTPSSPTSATATAAPTGGPTATTTGQGRPVPFAYPPLWPFGTAAEVGRWQAEYRAGGHAPWHLDAEATALAFTTGYLGFAGIDTVVWSSVTAAEALVAVGYPIPDRPAVTAAVLHLARYGTDADSPWEVVGSRDTDFTLTRPGYGTRAGSPLTAGGLITGVDESIRVQVRQPSTVAPLGEACCVPAGGDHAAWSGTVTYTGATAPVLTVIASTGGHYTAVERFAITAIRP